MKWLKLVGLKWGTLGNVCLKLGYGKTIDNIKDYLHYRSRNCEVSVQEALLQAFRMHTDLYPGLDQQKLQDTFFKYPIAANATPATNSQRSFIIDSGATFQLVSEDELTAKEKSRVRESGVPMDMQTANRFVTAKSEVEVFSKDLGVTVTAYTLPKVPPVLSLGKLCRENGFRFHWEPVELPFLQHVKSGTNH